jgi:hypothetical protein
MCRERRGGVEGEPVWGARRKTPTLEKRWNDGQVEAHQAPVAEDQDFGDEGDQGGV